jgi:hypothetical protein
MRYRQRTLNRLVGWSLLFKPPNSSRLAWISSRVASDWTTVSSPKRRWHPKTAASIGTIPTYLPIWLELCVESPAQSRASLTWYSVWTLVKDSS